MEIAYRNKGIEKVCTNAAAADRKYGSDMAEKIHMRIGELIAAPNIEFMIKYHVGRCHLLRNDRKGHYAVDLVNPMRMVFEIKGNEVQIALIDEITDYH